MDFHFTEFSCPADCSSAGICNNWRMFMKSWKIWSRSNFNSYFTEFSCPADCSSAGNCDTSTGECSCDPGRFGADCSITTTTTVTTTTTTTTTTKRTFLQIAAHNEVISPGKVHKKSN